MVEFADKHHFSFMKSNNPIYPTKYEINIRGEYRKYEILGLHINSGGRNKFSIVVKGPNDNNARILVRGYDDLFKQMIFKDE